MSAQGKTISHLLTKQPIRIVRSTSAEEKQKVIRDITVKCKGRYESVLELGGTVIGSNIFVTDCLIPRATIGFAHFKVEDRDLSACWSEAEKSPGTQHLKPVGDLHYHPEDSRSRGDSYDGPSPSGVDEANSLRQASLYFPFNLQTTTSEMVVAPEAISGQDGFARYRIDRLRSIRLPVMDRVFEIVFNEKQCRSLWGSLIYPSDACSGAVTASAIVHAYCPCDPDRLQVFRCENVESSVVPDEEVAQLTGWPLEKIRLQIDPQALEKEICDRYQLEAYRRYEAGWHQYGRAYADGYNADAYLPVCRQDPWHRPYWNGAVCAVEDTRSDLWEVLGALKTVTSIIEAHLCTRLNGDKPNFEQRKKVALQMLWWCVQSLAQPD